MLARAGPTRSPHLVIAFVKTVFPLQGAAPTAAPAVRVAGGGVPRCRGQVAQGNGSGATVRQSLLGTVAAGATVGLKGVGEFRHKSARDGSGVGQLWLCTEQGKLQSKAKKPMEAK